jgi:hypothetical protein
MHQKAYEHFWLFFSGVFSWKDVLGMLLGMAGAHLTGGLQQYHIFVYNCAVCLLNHFLFLARRHNETNIC